MSETDLVLLYTRRLERAGFTYMITGSVAGVFYGEPRVTHDVALVLALRRSDTARITELFPLEEFYCPPEEIIVQAMLRVSRQLVREDVLRRWMSAQGVEETWQSVEKPE